MSQMSAFGLGDMGGEPPLDALCFRTASTSTLGDAAGITNAAACVSETDQAATSASLGSNRNECAPSATELQNTRPNLSVTSGQSDRDDAHKDPVRANTVSNHNHNGTDHATKVSRIRAFFSFFRRSNADLMHQRTWPLINNSLTASSSSVDSLDGITSVNLPDNSTQSQTPEMQQQTRRKSSLLGSLFSQKSKLGKSAPAAETLSNLPQVVPSTSSAAVSSRQFDSDDEDVGCLACSTCDDDKRDRLREQDSASPVDTANDYLAALRDLMQHEQNATSSSVCHDRETGKDAVSGHTSCAHDPQCGIFTVSQNAMGSARDGQTFSNVANPTVWGPGSSNDQASDNDKEGAKSLKNTKRSKTRSDSAKNMSLPTVISSSATNLTLSEEQDEQKHTASGVVGEEKEICVEVESPVNKTWRRALSEASIPKCLLNRKKSTTASAPALEKVSSDEGSTQETPGELYPVDLDVTVLQLDAGSNAVRFYLDRQDSRPMNTCDDKLDSVEEESDEQLESAVSNGTHLAEKQGPIKQQGLTLQAAQDQFQLADKTALSLHEASSSEDMLSPGSHRRGLVRKLTKNMDKPKESTPSSSATRSRSGSLPVLFGGQKGAPGTAGADQGTSGLQKLHSIDESAPRKYSEVAAKPARQRKRSVFGPPAKIPEADIRGKVRRAATSVQESKVRASQFLCCWASRNFLAKHEMCCHRSDFFFISLHLDNTPL